MNSLEQTRTRVMDPHEPLPPAGQPEVVRPPHPGRWVLIAALLVAAGVLAGLWPRLRQQRATVERTRELAVPTVTVTQPKAATPRPALPLPAELKANTEATLFGRANGYVQRVLVDIGSQVEAGQLLAEIDTPELDAQLVEARAQLNEAEAARGLAEETAKRWTELMKSNSVSAQEDAEKQADFLLKTASVEAARAKLKRLEEAEEFSRVVAPFAGTVTARTTDVGDLVSAETPHSLFRLADTRKLRVFVRVPQSLTRLATVGTAAELTLPESPNQRFAAIVERTAGSLDPQSRTLLVELTVDNAKGEILAGGYGQVRLQGTLTNATLSLPSNTLLFRPEGTLVGLVKSDQTVELRPVTLGRDFGREIEIISGVNSNDVVILNPRDSLGSGNRVRVAKSAER
ncbi:MAG: efflux RND transporter periplasmic adaptor subunit [Verrucomicrobia bacterium]|nr:efflux RND transporter periplasmic adaptor subunit [Verrucomicrobiota bacterium]